MKWGDILIVFFNGAGATAIIMGWIIGTSAVITVGALFLILSQMYAIERTIASKGAASELPPKKEDT